MGWTSTEPIWEQQRMRKGRIGLGPIIAALASLWLLAGAVVYQIVEVGPRLRDIRSALDTLKWFYGERFDNFDQWGTPFSDEVPADVLFVAARVLWVVALIVAVVTVARVVASATRLSTRGAAIACLVLVAASALCSWLSVNITSNLDFTQYLDEKVGLYFGLGAFALAAVLPQGRK